MTSKSVDRLRTCHFCGCVNHIQNTGWNVCSICKVESWYDEKYNFTNSIIDCPRCETKYVGPITRWIHCSGCCAVFCITQNAIPIRNTSSCLRGCESKFEEWLYRWQSCGECDEIYLASPDGSLSWYQFETSPEIHRNFRSATVEGEVDSQYWIGYFYFNGVDVKRDPTPALFWFLYAARGGSIKAMRNLATMYQRGMGVMRADAVGQRWLALSGEYEEAKLTMGGAILSAPDEFFQREAIVSEESSEASVPYSDSLDVDTIMDQFDKKGLESFAVRVLEDSDFAIVASNKLFKLCGLSVGEDTSNTEYAIAEFFEGGQVGIAPDIRIDGFDYSWNSKAVLFNIPEWQSLTLTQEYFTAKIFLHLAVTVSSADGYIADSQKKHIEEYLESELHLPKNEKVRIKGYLQWLQVAQPDFVELGLKLKHLHIDMRNEIGDFCMTVACADGYIDPDEVIVTEKIFSLLNLNLDNVKKSLEDTLDKLKTRKTDIESEEEKDAFMEALLKEHRTRQLRELFTVN